MARAYVHPRAMGWARARSDRLNRSCADARTETNRYGDERRVETRRGRTGRRPSLPVVSWTDGRDERRDERRDEGRATRLTRDAHGGE